jgi:copper transporter 1
MFAGSCIGVILLVIALEFLRRSGKEYDRYILREHQKKLAAGAVSTAFTSPRSSVAKDATTTVVASGGPAAATFRPNVFQQAVRALIHMTAFAVAYFIML